MDAPAGTSHLRGPRDFRGCALLGGPSRGGSPSGFCRRPARFTGQRLGRFPRGLLGTANLLHRSRFRSRHGRLRPDPTLFGRNGFGGSRVTSFFRGLRFDRGLRRTQLLRDAHLASRLRGLLGGTLLIDSLGLRTAHAA